MSCPSNHRLAAASRGEDAAAELHAETCVACRAELDAMAAVVALARRVPVAALPADRRAMLEAAVMAESDAAPIAALAPPRRAAQRIAIAMLAAGVVVTALVVALRRERPAPPAVASAAPGDAVPPRPPAAAAITGVAPGDAAPAWPPDEAVIASAAPGDAAAAWPADEATPAPSGAAPRPPRRTAPPRRDVTQLADGPVTIDARNAAPVRVAAGDTAVQIAASKVEVTAHGGVVTMVRVFAGSAEIVHTGQRTVVVAGDIWVRPAGPAAALRAFEQGWLALRASHHREAIAAFDRAADPVIAEDAAYWAAIAAERAGDHRDAARRLRDFIKRFPRSLRVGDARRILDGIPR